MQLHTIVRLWQLAAKKKSDVISLQLVPSDPNSSDHHIVDHSCLLARRGPCIRARNSWSAGAAGYGRCSQRACRHWPSRAAEDSMFGTPRYASGSQGLRELQGECSIDVGG